ncbi:hypothetical protein E2C01_044383 [Portunus trituberculatus]|uniref:Uncharacterized protein n=1 Tax=Portunus trituberculatus TaxID=210409 RepID=A0A5B7G258_PORTR|nr:hypothetical protein [Portunus trituberculatus]
MNTLTIRHPDTLTPSLTHSLTHSRHLSRSSPSPTNPWRCMCMYGVHDQQDAVPARRQRLSGADRSRWLCCCHSLPSISPPFTERLRSIGQVQTGEIQAWGGWRRGIY